jgi:plastocyanin
MRFKPVLSIAGITAMLAVGIPISVSATAPQTYTIGVDHFDPANQQIDPATGGPLDGGRFIEYTDFFTRSVQVHSGDVLDFRVAIPDHVIQVTPLPGPVARQQFPLFLPDEENAIGSGGPKAVLGPAVLSALGGGFQTCGDSAASPCDPSSQFAVTTFPGGPNTDWFVAINGAPGTSFNYLCHFHPGMKGTITVVDSGTPIGSPADVSAQADAQFVADQTEAEATYAQAQVPTFTGGAPGSRTYQVHVGVTTDDRHVAIHGMLPSTLNLVSGDIVRYDWEFNAIHTVSFEVGPGLISPFGIDCGTSYVPLNAPPPPFPACTEFENGQREIILDPGTRSSGQVLNKKFGADSGVLVGADYGAFYGNLGASSWSVKTSQPGSYAFRCTIHDWMTGTLNVSGD